MRPQHCLFLATTVLLLAACQQRYSHLYYSTWSPRSISRVAVTGGTPTPIVPGAVSEALAIDNRAQVLYSGTESAVVRWSLDGKHLGSFNPPKNERALALDAKGGHIYLAEERGSHDIVRTDLDGKNLAVIVQNARFCQALAFDGKRGILYFSREHPSGVWRCKADGSAVQPVATETLVPKAIAVDEARARVYWACSDFRGNTAHIKRAKLDGTEATTVLEKLPYYVEALEVDSAAGRIFWIERPSGGTHDAHIRSAKLDGSDVRTSQDFGPGNFARALALGRLPKKGE